ncbi:MAG: AarF/ABC1/UbiB kinase family protein, partial [Acidimicrobiales bacterium]
MAEYNKDERSSAQSVVPKGSVRRTAPMAGFAARTAGERIVAALRAKTGDETAKAEFHERTAERYAYLLGHSKSVLMKAGQLLSFVDLGSGDPTSSFGIYQAALERLQADAPPMDADTAREVVESELGKPIDELFARFEPDPLAAASIGQVHEAVLHDGRKVAVKVQYPGVADAIRADLANTELLATFMQLGTSMVPKYTRVRQRPAAREISARIAEEVDYHHEARNIDRFADHYRGHPFIDVPEVIREVSTARVLTMTFIDGMGWAKARVVDDQELKNRWGEVLYRFGVGT